MRQREERGISRVARSRRQRQSSLVEPRIESSKLDLQFFDYEIFHCLPPPSGKCVRLPACLRVWEREGEGESEWGRRARQAMAGWLGVSPSTDAWKYFFFFLQLFFSVPSLTLLRRLLLLSLPLWLRFSSAADLAQIPLHTSSHTHHAIHQLHQQSMSPFPLLRVCTRESVGVCVLRRSSLASFPPFCPSNLAMEKRDGLSLLRFCRANLRVSLCER